MYSKSPDSMILINKWINKYFHALLSLCVFVYRYVDIYKERKITDTERQTDRDDLPFSLKYVFMQLSPVYSFLAMCACYVTFLSHKHVKAHALRNSCFPTSIQLNYELKYGANKISLISSDLISSHQWLYHGSFFHTHKRVMNSGSSLYFLPSGVFSYPLTHNVFYVTFVWCPPLTNSIVN